LLLLLTSEVRALDFTYTNTNGTITITGYTGPGGNVTIPSTINGLPVTSIADWAFSGSGTLTMATIPDSVTNIGDSAFNHCANLVTFKMGNGVTSIGSLAFVECISLTSISIPDSVRNIKDGFSTMGAPYAGAFSQCPSLTNATIGSSVTNIGDYAFADDYNLRSATILAKDVRIGSSVFYDCLSLTNFTIPDGVSSIGDYAFDTCLSLTSLTIGQSLTNIGDFAFQGCSNLVRVYFKGNSPSVGLSVFLWGNNPTIYYLPRTTGWTSTFGGRPAVLWNPLAQTNDASFGVRQNRFGFNISGTPDIPIVVEASTSLAAQSWVPLQSCTLTNGLIYFSDAQSTTYPGRFYRIRSP
jgi:hypothetical protein